MRQVRFFVAACLALGMLGLSGQAMATSKHGVNEGPTSTCNIVGEIRGISAGFVFGGQYLGGKGVVTCTNGSGVTTSMPIDLTLVSAGWSFDFTLVRSVKVVAVGVSVTNGPMDFVRSYNIGATAGATLLSAGVDFDAAIKLNDGHLGFEVGLKGKKAYGLGVRLHGMIFYIQQSQS